MAFNKFFPQFFCFQLVFEILQEKQNLFLHYQRRLQVSQNIRFCLQLEMRAQIRTAEFKETNWLNIDNRFSQGVLSSIYKFFNNVCPEYFNEFIFLLKEPLGK